MGGIDKPVSQLLGVAGFALVIFGALSVAAWASEELVALYQQGGHLAVATATLVAGWALIGAAIFVSRRWDV